MLYYIYKNKEGKVIGTLQTDKTQPSPAIEVSKEEFIACGGIVEEVIILPTNEELAKENKLLKAKLDASSKSQQFLEDCLAEMAQEVYK